MCTPTAIVGMQAAGAASSTVGSFYGAKAAKADALFQADMAAMNAAQAEKSAQRTLLAGQTEEQRVRLATAQLKSRQRAAMAASGVALDSASAVNVLTSTDVMGDIDANTVAMNALAAAWGQRVEATNYTMQGTMARASARGISPAMAGFSSALTGATQVASTWYSLNKVGAFDKPGAGGDGVSGSGFKAPKGTWGGS